MFWLQNNPFVRIIIPLICGILLAEYLFPDFITIIPVLIIFFIWTLIFSLNYVTGSYRLRWLNGSLLLLFLVLFGMYYQNYRKNLFSDCLSSEYDGKQIVLLAQIVNDVEIRNNSVKTVIKHIAISEDNVLKEIKGRSAVYFAKDTVSIGLKYGDMIVCSTTLQKPDTVMNPEGFNYRLFLSRLGIGHVAWVGSGKIQKISSGYGNKIFALSLNLRNNILGILEKQLGKSDEYKVASAILTGYRGEMDFDMRQHYAKAGAMHVMCVSGLHVGVIYVILTLIFSFLSDRKKLQHLLKIILILLFIWFYAMLTGLSPSVLRASAMFSFVAIGSLSGRKIPIYNSLAASALLILLINPQTLFDTGFQLSYFAVVGIVSIYPYLKNLFPAKRKFTEKIRDLVAVSLAAQLMTAPLSLYYFNQFPNYFLLTNIIVVPLAGFIVYAAFPALIFAQVPYIGSFFAVILSWLIKIMNFTVEFIEKLPGSVTEFIYITPFQIVILYAAILTALLAVETKKHGFALAGLTCMVLFSAIQAENKILNLKTEECVIPSVQNFSGIFVSGQKCTILTDDTSAIFKQKLEQNYNRYFSMKGIKELSYIPLDTVVYDKNSLLRFPFFQFDSIRIAVWNKEWAENEHIEKLKVNYLLLQKAPVTHIEDIFRTITPQIIILTANNKKNNIRKWEKILQEQNIPYINMLKVGAVRFIKSD